MARGPHGRPRQGVRGWQFVVASAALSLVMGRYAAAAEVETRDFTVYVDAKKAGDMHMTINRQDDGATSVSCDTDVSIGAIITLYKYSYRGRELWKDGRLQRFESKCNDNGKEFVVSAMAADDGLHVKVNNVEHITSADAMLTSYWTQPDATLKDQTVPLLDADCGRDLEGKVQSVGPEKYVVQGKGQTVQHVRLTGKNVEIDLWYDDARRLVREEWVEDGHRTVVSLIGVRR
jgi:Family of unknown function (DUF6134)